ncbi:MAG TPA: phage protein Gp36 family protein [Streptosporangiaceae bacterium]|jgi:phage gp36-like protein
MATLYATVADLKSILSSTDSGTGTAAELTDEQLTQALQAGSNRVSIYAGSTFDSSTPQAVPPPAFNDLTLDLAAFYATATYMKHKVITAQHPIMIRYKDAMALLESVRKGEVRLDPAVPGSVGAETGTVINRIPKIFTHDDSNTRISPVTGYLEVQTAWTGAGWEDLDSGGPVYQG